MLVSDELSYPDVFGVLEAASRRLGREVKPTIYSHGRSGPSAQRAATASSSVCWRSLASG
jgi:hypothetical protein